MSKQRMTWDQLVLMIAEAINDLEWKQVKAILPIIVPGIIVTPVKGKPMDFDVTWPPEDQS